MTIEKYIVIPAPFGSVRVTLTETHVSRIEPLAYLHPESDNQQSTGLSSQVTTQFQSYFKTNSPFTFPIITSGTDFQQRVWRFLQSIPDGETRTYGDVARVLLTSARAVGGACGRNTLAILIPCHRVISASGQGGYCGKTTGAQIRIKSWLLEHENR